MGDDAGRAQAQQVFLAHRFLEDWGYQTVARREARAWLETAFGRRDPDPADADQVQAASEWIGIRLENLLRELRNHGIGNGMFITPGSVRLPWRRTFEVDFWLE